jgi:hypothetical protein
LLLSKRPDQRTVAADSERGTMNRHLLKDALGWGFVLWFIGYVLGILLFALLPTPVLGWIILPIGVVITLWVLLKRVNNESLQYYAIIAIAWAAIAIIFDYIFIVKAFKPADGYYKADVYIYYALTFVLPLLVGWRKTSVRK